MTFTVFLWLLLSMLAFSFGEYFSKIFTTNPTAKNVAFILFSYMMGTVCWLPAIYQAKILSIVGTIWSVLSILSTVFIGIFIFGETLTILQITGIIFAIISIVLLTI